MKETKAFAVSFTVTDEWSTRFLREARRLCWGLIDIIWGVLNPNLALFCCITSRCGDDIYVYYNNIT